MSLTHSESRFAAKGRSFTVAALLAYAQLLGFAGLMPGSTFCRRLPRRVGFL